MPPSAGTSRPADLDRPPADPVLVEVPERAYLMIDGKGGPEGPEYAAAIMALFSVSYPIVIELKRTGRADLKVGPLEGLWWLEGEDYHDFEPRTSDRSLWRWTAMIRRPDDVPNDLHDDAVARASRKVGPETAARLRVHQLYEGQCAQLMHAGPYSEEAPNIARLHEFIDEQGLQPRGRHHEIYLTDARRTAPDRMRTVLRQPVG